MRKPRIFLRGDAQAEAIALIFRSLPSVSRAYEVIYGGTNSEDDVTLAARDLLLQQDRPDVSQRFRMPKRGRLIAFPGLQFRLLWPLAAPQPGGPSGASARFAWGDGFVFACTHQGISPDEIFQHYKAEMWNSSWPNLDVLFSNESTRLMAGDAKCDVKIGSFVLKHFRKTRLFWAPNMPTNALLGELAYRLLHACFGADLHSRNDIDETLAGFSNRDVFARTALPIQKPVAAHWDLSWYDEHERYLALDGVERDLEEYYRALIEDAYAHRYASRAVSAPAAER